MEALRHEKRRRKRGKKLIEQFRVDEGFEAILFSPGKVKAALELQDKREQEFQGAKERREDRAIAQAARNSVEPLEKAQRETERAATKAQKQAELELKAQNKRPRGRPRKQQVPTEPIAVEEPPRAEEAPIQPRSGSGKIIRPPKHRAS
ncbi:Hypothetical protein D9617_62g044190 [Elsinoe fawcettii]|nr:Hypothetical protein D9617_62g044190 [Elsinoe fawcettii]